VSRSAARYPVLPEENEESKIFKLLLIHVILVVNFIIKGCGSIQ